MDILKARQKLTRSLQLPQSLTEAVAFLSGLGQGDNPVEQFSNYQTFFILRYKKNVCNSIINAPGCEA